MTSRVLSLLLLFGLPLELNAQATLSGRLTEHATNRPMRCQKVVLLDVASLALDSTVTGVGGTFEFSVPASITFRLKIGEAPAEVVTVPERADGNALLTREYRIPWIELTAQLPDTVKPDSSLPFRISPRSPGPQYPEDLWRAGIEGSTLYSIVIDTLGRIDTASAFPLRATHPQFARAVRDVIPRIRYERWSPMRGETCALLQQYFAFTLRR